jgi:signal transduction histidine kinase/DNA-binding LacI/PurR family transcriptional regulator/CheY-like chemotaxis protein
MKHQGRIGVFVNDLLSPYQIRLFNSIKRAANSRGVRVIGFQGSFLLQPDQGEHTAFDGSFIYGLAGEESVDGLIIASGVLSSRAGIDAVYDLYRKSKLPVVSIGRLPGVAGIEIGSGDALMLLVNHLVLHHLRQRIVLIEGPKGNPDSIERSRIVRDALNKLNVPLRDSHVLTGDFLETSGAEAVRVLLDQRGIAPSDFDAVIALNDQMAVGAMHELASRGIRIPGDVSVVGFDDDEFARSSNPPLTTISQPIELIGERAIHVVMALMRGESVEDRNILDAEPVWRRSCGCEVPHVSRYTTVNPGETSAGDIALAKKTCYERYERLAGLLGDARVIETAVAAINADHEEGVNQRLQELEVDILRAFENGIDPLRWHDVLSPVSDLIERAAAVDGAAGRRRARRLRVIDLLINDVAARIRALDHLHTMQWTHAARVLSNALLSVRHVHYLTSVLNAGLPSLGIKYCCVCLFVGEGEPRNACVAALYSPSLPPPPESPRSPAELWLAAPGSIPPEPSETSLPSIFPAFELVHPQLRKSDSDSLDLSIYPLVYAHATLGYVVFDAPTDAHQSWLLEGLAGSLSSAVYAMQRNAELREARDKAERANAAKTEFVAMISHELRTPLTAIMGHVDLCRQTELNEEQQRHLQQAQVSLGSLINIVNDILDFSKVEAQKIEIESEPFALDEVLDQVVATCAQSATRKGLCLLVDAEPDIPHWVRGDALRLSQVLLNLVGNAIKFSTKGDIRVTVCTAEDNLVDDLVLRFIVEDDGIGMSEEELARIFNPFTQGDGSMTRKYGGTGLGLTISRKLVELMNGSLIVTSELDKGSRFEFTVRLKPCEYPIEDLIRGAGKHLLVIEEDRLLRQSLSNLLTSYGFHVVCVSNAEAGIELLSRPGGFDVCFDLVVGDFDADLQDKSAFWRRAVRAIDQAGSSVLLLTSTDNEPEVKEIFADLAPLPAVIQKPFQRRYLTQVIAHALSSQRGFGSAARALFPKVPENTRILVVQDDPMTCDVLSEILSKAGAKVSIATTGGAAVESVRHLRFDLIFQDLHLPDIDGFATALAIRETPNGAEVPILALSAGTMRHNLERCLEAGINDFVEAPVASQALIRIVNRWVLGERFSSTPTKDPTAAPFPSISQEFASPRFSPAGADLDTEKTLERLGGDKPLFVKLLQRFRQSHEVSLKSLRQALDQRNLQSAILYAHTLASTAANIGAGALYETAKTIETCLHKDDPKGAWDCLTDLEMAVSRSAQAVEKYLSDEVKSGESSEAPDEKDWRETAHRLLQHIESNDSAALDVLGELRSALGAKLSAGQAFLRLEDSVTAYDFEQARVHLDALIRWVKESRGKSPAAD